MTMRHNETPQSCHRGYSLDLVGEPCVLVLRRPNGKVVARFTHNVDPQEIRRAAEGDYKGLSGAPPA